MCQTLPNCFSKWGEHLSRLVPPNEALVSDFFSLIPVRMYVVSAADSLFLFLNSCGVSIGNGMVAVGRPVAAIDAVDTTVQ